MNCAAQLCNQGRKRCPCPETCGLMTEDGGEEVHTDPWDWMDHCADIALYRVLPILICLLVLAYVLTLSARYF